MSPRGGREEARPSVERLCACDVLGLACISPLAVATLLVKDEIAQPAQDVSFRGVPMRGTPPLAALVLGGGRTESGNELPYFLTRCWKTSKVLLAWSRTSLHVQ